MSNGNGSPRINPALFRHTTGRGIDMNALLEMLKQENTTCVGLICVKRNYEEGKGNLMFIQWINTPENIQSEVLDGLAKMQKQNLISKSILSL